MTVDELLALPQYSLRRREKDEVLLAGLLELTERHRERCPEYRRVLSSLYPGARRSERPADVPWLPVALFKTHALRSITQDEVFKTLTSSGTTSSTVSRIFLDADSAARQTRALASVIGHVLGRARLPMLIVDTPTVIRDRRAFSARGAGVRGMSMFGRDHLYVLDESMELDREALSRFLAAHAGEQLLIFGFTFMVWRYLLQAIEPGEFELHDATLIHSGGWKKLEQESVGNAEFKQALRAATGLRRVFNFYGMVEQIGSVFLECEHGLLHAPNFGDVIVRDPVTWEEARDGEQGVIQVLSLLPTSYPGHSILTEDLGRVLARDDCGCGRRGKAIALSGRIPSAELRGCSDTHAFAEQVAA